MKNTEQLQEYQTHYLAAKSKSNHVEVKDYKGKQSPAQIKIQKKLEKYWWRVFISTFFV
jgi:hypothetical protein